MPPLVHPTLVNEGSGDPGLFLPFSYQRHAYLFDMGDISALAPRNLLKISHVFVSHTHMDHFVGFDHLLRIVLGREKTIHLFGPRGFIDNVEGKLAGYAWNLVETYANPLTLKVTEVTRTHLITRTLSCARRFQPVSEDLRQSAGSPPVLHEDASHRVRTAILDHGIPCLAFSLEENYRINIRKEALSRLGLTAGAWLQDFKRAVFENRDTETAFSVPSKNEPSGVRRFRLGDLEAELAVKSRGQKICYVSDIGYTSANITAIRRLAGDCDHLFIEAAFLEADRGHAEEKNHLTAQQAGHIAGLVNAERFTLFHFSPRYEDREADFYAEAGRGYNAARQKELNPRAGG
jgi:ribonuclease Z